MVHPDYRHLFQPIKIGPVSLPNRIVMSPMNEGNCTNSTYVERTSIAYYGARAKGGAGLIITDCMTVSSKEQDPYSPEKRLFVGERPFTIAEIAREIALNGAVPAIQFSPGLGARSLLPVDHNRLPADVSPMPCRTEPETMCRELTREEIQQLVKRFGDAAEIALRVGYKLCHLNSHGGYMFPRFLSPVVNKRTDEYGGNTENRFRFLKEVVQEIKRRTNGQLAVALRLSLERLDYLQTTLDESLKYCKLAEEAGFDMLDVDAGSTDNEVMYFYPTCHLGETPLAEYTKIVKKTVNIPVAAVGGYIHPEQAERMIANGDADLVFLGRPLLADPEWPNKARTGRADEIRPCIQCLERCVDNISAGKRLGCAVNPRCGFESYVYPEIALEPKKVVIVGAGPGGMSAALTASQRGHKVVLLEQEQEIGGQLRFASKESYKYGMRKYVEYLKRQLELSKIECHLGCTATLERINEEKPDAVILATGARQRKLEIPGMELVPYYTVEDDFLKDIKPDEKVVIIGAGMIGCEAALELAQRGIDTSLIEMTTTVAKGSSAVNRVSILRALEQKNVPIYTETKSERVAQCSKGTELICSKPDGSEQKLPCDRLIVAVGSCKITNLEKDVQDHYYECYTIGDCVNFGKVADAVEQGFYTAMRI